MEHEENKQAEKEFEISQKKEESEIEKCARERDEYIAGWQRAKADFINYKREEAKRFEELVQYANTVLLQELITVMDDFDMAFRAQEKTGSTDKGIYFIKTHLEEILRHHGLEKIPLKVPAPFDTNIMEAIEEVHSAESPGMIVEEIAPGYRIHEKIVRAARVKVSKGKENQ